METLTISQTIAELHKSLSNYIEAAYHISDPFLIRQRRTLLYKPNVIHQPPFIESNPIYRLGSKFDSIDGLHPAAIEIFQTKSNLSSKPLLFDPPYEHQAIALRESLVNKKSIVIATGTGSGKTECFLLPILGKLAIEAKENPKGFHNQAAVRAIILYPMNALVNDQLGRLRLLFGNKSILKKFDDWAGRPARFARYTSRTLYPGVRRPDKDSTRLKSLGDFYVRYEELANDPSADEHESACLLIEQLKKHGKWPAKESMVDWYGKRRTLWRERNGGQYIRCVTMPNDAELFTRHEVQHNPPDILVTNYSMLEYMLMRPIERPIFDKTRKWLKDNPDEKFMLVVDEAHLYRGAAGAEVALLIRRLRMRLGIIPERLQVICTSASFQNLEIATRFGAQLTGKNINEFAPTIEGTLFLREPANQGHTNDATILADIDLNTLYDASTSGERLEVVKPFLDFREVKNQSNLELSLWKALNSYPPMNLLINCTMQETMPLEDLGKILFENTDTVIAEKAVSVLLALGSLAREKPNGPNLIPCRIHAFFRGLPGLWVCMDPNCTILPDSNRGKGPTGQIYSQPQDVCKCGARVLELFTCRNCGTAYARAYTDNPGDPTFLWAQPGRSFSTFEGDFPSLQPLDILLEEPLTLNVEPVEFDLVTGRINPQNLGKRTRSVYIRKDRCAIDRDGKEIQNPGEFRPCAVCEKIASFGRTYVQDHQTKGDQPFGALISKQLQVQPPNPETPATAFAPLRGRKVLIFSDSRQGAARLAPRLQGYSTQDALRPLIIYGYNRLQQKPLIAKRLCLNDLYFVVLVAAVELGVRLRPALKSSETFNEYKNVKTAIDNGILEDDEELEDFLLNTRGASIPESLLNLIYECITDTHYGFESLALATLCERPRHTQALVKLPSITGIVETNEQKLALARMWINGWQQPGFWLQSMPDGWRDTKIKTHKGQFAFIKRFLGNSSQTVQFKNAWIPRLLQFFTDMVAGQHRCKGSELSLMVKGNWAYCRKCRTTQRPFPGKNTCRNCGRDHLVQIDPSADSVFKARKGYYRVATLAALNNPPKSPISMIAAEHTAQLSTAQKDAVFSDAEENELLFQDININPKGGISRSSAIDVLSCTTTMEVGIDIGKLSGVALRNMPPARSNYQQRSGRAGRRGNAVATVIAFGSVDSHDEEYFRHPNLMIRGPVQDPRLTLDNVEITSRHILAYLLQRYHQEKLPDIPPEDQPQLFEVLGTAEGFLEKTTPLNLHDFIAWLKAQKKLLKEELSQWLPTELQSEDRNNILKNFIQKAKQDLFSSLDVNNSNGRD